MTEDLYNEFYDQGSEMSYQSADKAGAFEDYFQTYYSGSSARFKKQARKAYNHGWADYKRSKPGEYLGGGQWSPPEEDEMFGYGKSFMWLMVSLGLMGLAIWLLSKKKDLEQQKQQQLPPGAPR